MTINPKFEMPRETVERIAKIIGPESAAARALADADSHDGPVKFYAGPASILVRKIPLDTGSDPS